MQVEQTETPQEMERTALRREMTAQAVAGGPNNPRVFDQGGIVQSASLDLLGEVVTEHAIPIAQKIALARYLTRRCHEGAWRSIQR